MANRKSSGWKKLFYSLLGINAFFIAVFLIFIFVPASSNPKVPDGSTMPAEEAGAEFTVNTSKQNLNELINAYVDLLLGDSGDEYSVMLENDVQLYGSIEAFGTDIPITIRLEPIVQENGDLVLEQKDISLGLLYLPNDKVLEYVEKRFEMPEFVYVNPAEENIYVAITEMELRSNFKVSVEEFNLPDDQLSFQIKVPNETLGL